MNRLFFALAFSLSASLVNAATVVGAWQSVTHERGALPGSITFGKDGRVTLHPTGFNPVHGKWKRLDKSPPTLRITLDSVGESDVQYSVQKQKLTLTYDNGNTQTFTKAPATPKK